MKLFLFDIDGTLVSTLGEGGHAFKEAYRDIFKKELNWSHREFSGRTDQYICETGLNLIQANTEENRRKLLKAYVENLKRRLDQKAPLVLPGVYEVIQTIQAQAHSVLGLLTGNIVSGARVKLGKMFGHFELGAFGDHQTDRNYLPELAYSLFKEKYGAYPEETFVIGDTPRDIQCAKAGKAKAIAVATGPYATEELAQADFVLDDLREWGRVFS